MKKKLLLLLLLLVALTNIFAGFGYRLDLVSFSPLYKEYNGDRERASMDFQYAYVATGYPEYFYQGYDAGNDKVRFFKFNEDEPLRDQPYIGVYRLGETLSLVQNTFTFDSWLSPIAFDFSFQGTLLGAMEGSMADIIGYDGIFFYGLTARVADMVSMKFGFNHHCSHYGDGTYKQLEDGGGVTEGFDEWFKYLRMDSLLFGLSIEPFSFLRLYGEINFNMKSTSILPNFFSPNWTNNGPAADGVPDSYGAMIVNFGVELEHPVFKKLGMTRLSYHCRAHEEGKIAYRNEDLAAAGTNKPFYDADRPWEFEHTVNLSQDINDLVSFDLTYHYGRFILNTYFATRSSYISLGGRLNFDGKINLVDVAR